MLIVRDLVGCNLSYQRETSRRTRKGHHHPSKANKLARWVRQRRSYDVGCRRSACRAEGLNALRYGIAA